MMMQTNQQQQGQRYRALGQQSLGGVLASGSSLINETIMEEGEEPKTQAPPPPKFGFRHVFALLGFLGFLNVYAMRVNMSVAIVAMTNSTTNNSISSNDTSGSCQAPIHPSNSSSADDQPAGDFNWDENTKSLILGCFFYGYVLTQIPGGRAAEKFGGKWIFGCGILLTSVFTILMPFAARFDASQGYQYPYFLVATRVIEGLGEGVTFPVMHAMLAQWSPPLERSKLSTFIYAGSTMGTIISLPLTGLICDYWGWEVVFYAFGSAGVVWFIVWAFLIYDTPSRHPFISKEEKDFIQASLGNKISNTIIRSRANSMSSSIISELDGSRIDDEAPIIQIESISSMQERPIPYRSIFTSIPFYAILIAHVAQNWGFYTLLNELPTYMSEILHFNIKENAFLSALPYLCMWICAIVGSQVADHVRSKGYLTTTATRKWFNTIAFILPAICLVMISYAGCNKPLVIALLCATVGINGFQFSSVSVNHIDIASNFAGTLMGLTNTLANTMGFLAPQIIGKIIDHHEDQAHWQTVFYIAAAVYAVGNVLYCLMASGDEQPWNQTMQENQRNNNSGDSAGGPIIASNVQDLIGSDNF